MKKTASVAVFLILVAAGALSAQRVVFSDDMSDFPTGWTRGTNGPRPDSWTAKPNRWYSSSLSAKCTGRDTPATYPDSLNVWMAHPVNLAGYATGVLTFWAWQRSEGGYDSLFFEYSTNGGSTWNRLWGRSGVYVPWRRITLSNIPANADWLRFRFASDPSAGEEGVYIDDVVLYGMDTTGTTVWFDDMTNFPAGWVLREPSDDYWGRTAYRYLSPGHSAQCAGRDTGYFNGMAGRMSRGVHLQPTPYAALSFGLYIDVEDEEDYLDAQYHNGFSWIGLGRYTGTEDWNRYNYELPGDADSIRFFFHSDVSITRQGAYVDDVLVRDFRNRASDMSCPAISSPPPDVDSGGLVPIAAQVWNNGPFKAAGPVYFTIDDGSRYRQMVTVESLVPGTGAALTFPDWAADIRPGIYPYKCSTGFVLDNAAGNNQLVGYVTVANQDAGVENILAPVGLVPPGSVVPRVTLRNHGNSRPALNATFRIPSAGYVQTVVLAAGLPVRVDTVVEFPAWTAVAGVYPVSCSLRLVGDQIRSNNVLSETCLVGDTGWVRMDDVPFGPKSKKVKDGCCLTYAEFGDTGRVFGLKGNNTLEFYSYDPVSNVWSSRESMPAIGSSGRKKRVKTGGSVTTAGDRLYALKGNNTLEFWEYVPGTAGYPWRQLADVTAGAKRVKDGAGLAAIELSGIWYVYMLKGSNTWEFYRYNTLSGAWEPLPNAPPGVSGRTFKKGSCLAYDPGTNSVLVQKGTYNEMFAFDLGSSTWQVKPGMPFVGRDDRRKKLKDGAGMVIRDGKAYALKGGNTLQFWVYDIGAGIWYQSSDYPLGAGRNVKGGGAIVYAQNAGALFATKGNNTFEFARFQLAGTLSGRLPAMSSAQGSSELQAASFKLEAFPNPFSGATTISYSLPRAGPVSLRLFDVTGKLVRTLADGQRQAGLSTASLSAGNPSAPGSLSRGVYLLRLETESENVTRKLAVE